MAHFILTNDDGIDAPGIQALRRAVEGESVTVAPRDHQSGCSHRVTTTEGPILIEERGPGAYAVAGTPADCTRVALHHLGFRPRYVLSGINAGGNLGWDIYPSGTVAAAREAAYLGVPGIAVSQYIKKGSRIDWDRAAAMTNRVLGELLVRDMQPGAFWNVNLPHLDIDEPEPDLVYCEPCRQPLPVSFRVGEGGLLYTGEYSLRPRDPGADVDLCFSGKITVSLLRI
jgi:5'-nucleotidase